MKTSILGRIVRVADNLFRDPKTDAYYGVKKIAGKRKVKALKMGEGRAAPPVIDRKTAVGKLKAWLLDLDAAGQSAVDLKLEALLQSFLATRKGKAKKTVGTENGFANILRKGFTPGMSIPVRKIKTSQLIVWLGDEEARREWKAETYNRARFFLRQLFDIAVADGVVTEAMNPFKPKLIPRRKSEKTIRRIPTLEQFEKIVANVRSQISNPGHEESADFLAFLGLAGIGQAEAASIGRFNVVNGKINVIRQKTRRSFSFPVYEWLAPLVKKLMVKPYGKGGKFFSVIDCGNALTRACARLNFPAFTQRNLRAMNVKRLYDAGVPVKRIALWQGHNDGGKLIQQIYTEVFCDNDAAAEAADLALVTTGKVIKFKAA
jgi:integrase